MSGIIDLDALVPKPATIRFDNTDIVVQPPKTVDIMLLGALVDRMDALDPTNTEESQKLIDEFTAYFHRIIPELQGKTLFKLQIQILIAMIYDMVIPPETKELLERGITVGGDAGKKKEQS